MADFKRGLYSWLQAQAPLVALVQTRIYPDLAPATAPLPYITYQRIAEAEEGHLEGLSGLTRAVYQFDVWGITADEAETVMLALKAALDRYRGLMGAIPVRQLSITSIVDGLEAPSDGQTQGVWRHTITADIWFHEFANV